MNIVEEVRSKSKSAKEASYILATLTSQIKNSALKNMAAGLRDAKESIKSKNAIDIENGKAAGLSSAMLDRLLLNDARIEGMAAGIEKIAALTDPVGEVIKGWIPESGINIKKVRVPIGVIGMIYESRPNVTADAAALALKSGNSIVLRGGKEAINSNIVIAEILKKAAVEAGIPEGAITLIELTDREGVKVLTQLTEFVDVIIPRGGSGLIKAVTESAKVPVIFHDKGVCHTFIDEFADIEMGKKICMNAKVQRPGVCNAMETLLVHENIAEKFLPEMAEEFSKAKVELRGCEKTLKILKNIKAATEEDWDTEYVDLILSIKVVKSVEEAISHINRYGSKHSDAIITNSYENSKRFTNAVDSATVYVNASTRFTDGGCFGFGAEIGISTNKIHARGPFALEELTTYKYIIEGEGQIRE